MSQWSVSVRLQLMRACNVPVFSVGVSEAAVDEGLLAFIL
jgi:hypothetical protein